jgi:threonine synthase
MEYISTRGSPSALTSKKAIIKGIAEDNGLFVPSSFPILGDHPFAGIPQTSYAARAVMILQSFLTDYTTAELTSACKTAYAGNFDSPLTAPVIFLKDIAVSNPAWSHLAFKDMAPNSCPAYHDSDPV